MVQTKLSVFKKKGAKIISLERIRDHVQYECTSMAVKFKCYFVRTQFHPEADPVRFIFHLRGQRKNKKYERREKIQDYA